MLFQPDALFRNITQHYKLGFSVTSQLSAIACFSVFRGFVFVFVGQYRVATFFLLRKQIRSFIVILNRAIFIYYTLMYQQNCT